MELLFRLFIKDKDNIEDEKVRSRYGVLGGIVGIVLNIFLFAFKLVAGTLTGSIATTADAMNNLSDAGSSIITLVGFKLAGKPAHNDHPFGHGRFEYITALFVSVAIILMGVELAKTSFDKILHPTKVEFSILSAVILIAAILVKGWMYLFNKKIGNKIKSQSMLATAKDSLSDAASTGAVLLSILIAHFMHVNIDGWMGMLVSLFILYTGVGALQVSIAPLLGQKPAPEFVKAIEETVMAHEVVLGIHDMIVHDYGPTRRIVSLHTEVPANVDILHAHECIDNIERELEEKFGCDAVIHMDPIETDNSVVGENRAAVAEILKGISESLSFHDFRMVSGKGHTNLIFDVVIPHEFEMSKELLDEEITKRVKEYNSSYFTVVHYDIEYTSHE